MSAIQQFEVPGLATVTLDTLRDYEPLLKIVLDPAYVGDLNDLEKANPYAPGVYLECDSTSCINDPLLAKFVEVLSHWDHDHDGNFDGDEIIDAIEAAMWRSRETPDVVVRPNGDWYTDLVMKLMPPAPERHIVFSFGELKERFRWYHYPMALLTFIAILALIHVQIQLLPITKYTVITGIMAIGEHFGINGWLALVLVFIALTAVRRLRKVEDIAATHSRHTYGFFNKAAVYEEQSFREGSENWSVAQRVASCIAFGAIHMTNLIYPLATILPLALGGAVFMVVYLRVYRRTKFRRSAVLASSLFHRVYNRLALTAFAITLIVILGWSALGLFGIAAVLAFSTIYTNRLSDNTIKESVPTRTH